MANLTADPAAYSSRWSLIFAAIGHFYFHFFTAMYFTIVLGLGDTFDQPFHELIELWTLGALLVGLAALPAGKLADMFGPAKVMAVFFVGMGIACVGAGAVSGPTALMIMLAGVGLFGAIYHPVGIPWVIRNSDTATGKMLAVNGVFGGLGAAAAGSITGMLVDVLGWRAAFWIPGAICVASGLHLWWYIFSGRVVEPTGSTAGEGGHSRGEAIRGFTVLLVSMFIAGIIYHATQAVLPKFFTERVPDFVEGSVFKAGVLVTIVYGVAAVMQLIGGHLADRYPLKRVYVICWLVQIGFLAALAGGTGLTVFATAILLATISTAQLPAENMLLARFTPERHHGLAFGLKFVLAFGAAPLAIEIVSFVRAQTGDFFMLFAGLSAVTAFVFLVVLLLPADRRMAVAAAE